MTGHVTAGFRPVLKLPCSSPTTVNKLELVSINLFTFSFKKCYGKQVFVLHLTCGIEITFLTHTLITPAHWQTENDGNRSYNGSMNYSYLNGSVDSLYNSPEANLSGELFN